MKQKATYITIIVALVIGLLFSINKCTDEVRKKEVEWRIKTDSLVKVSETQYTKLIADTLTISELRKEIKRLEIENIKKPKTVTVIDWKIRDGEKTVDTLYLPSEGKKLYISDFYPNKENPFVNYTLRDTIGKFKFYPQQIAIVVSENKDGTWKTDVKGSDYFEITDIKAVGIQRPTVTKTSPFYIGGGVQKQGEKYPLSVLGGFRVKRTIIFGGINTEGQVEIKTLYNL